MVHKKTLVLIRTTLRLVNHQGFREITCLMFQANSTRKIDIFKIQKEASIKIPDILNSLITH